MGLKQNAKLFLFFWNENILANFDDFQKCWKINCCCGIYGVVKSCKWYIMFS